MSFFESSEIVNNSKEENQNILKLIDGSVLLKFYNDKVKQVIKKQNNSSTIEYIISKKNSKEVMAVSKKENFVMFFNYLDENFVFSEFYDANHVASYFYSCKRNTNQK